jgi:hypothetical protein
MILAQVFKKDLNKADNEKLLGFKLQCDCQKDPSYKFGCKNAISWFINKSIISKI